MNESAAAPIPAKSSVATRLREAGVAFVFLARLHSMGCDHVALLVAEENVVRGKVATRGIPDVSVHFFTLSGAKSGGFRLDNPRYNSITLAFLPLEIAEYLMDRAARPGGLDALDEFHIAAYIQVYFGGCAHLLRVAAVAHETTDISDLANAAEVDPSVWRDRASLDAYLASIGWRPPIDMLERLGLADGWIRDALLPELVDDTAVPSGLTVFFSRARAAELGCLDTMRSAIEDSGFEVLLSCPLEGELATQVRRSVRGGNWGAGPWPVNGGPPIHLLFAVDVFPVEPDEATRAQHPFLDNARILTAKIAARDAVLAGIPSRNKFNALHSADNSAETLRFAGSILAEEALAELQSTFLSRRLEVDALIENTTPLEGDNTFSLSVRLARGSERRVRKIYRRQHLDNMQHDVEILDQLSPDWPDFPSLRKRGGNYLEVEDLGDDYVPLASTGDLAPINTVLRLREIFRSVIELGFDPVGWDPDQGIFVSSASGTLKILGFDRLHRLPKPPQFLEANCLTDPEQRQEDGNWRQWYPILGVPRAVFVRGGPTAMHLHRNLIFPLRRGFENVAATLEALKTNLRLQVSSLHRLLQRAR